MKICRITRPPLKEVATKFPQREHHVLGRLEKKGHTIIQYIIRPLKFPTKYLSYGIGLIISVIRFYKVKADVIIADNMESAVAAFFIRFFFSTPFVIDYIDDFSLIARDDSFRVRYYLIRFLERCLPKYADLIIVVDEHKRRFCLKIGIPEEDIVLIPNGTETDVFRPDTLPGALLKDNSLEDRHIIMFIGRLNKYYRIETIIEAAPYVVKKFPDAKFVLIGEGEHKEELINMSRKFGVSDAILFTGFMSPDQISGCIACADICYFPLPDSSALVIYEYMSSGKPTVIPEYKTEKMGISNDILPDDCLMKVENTPLGIAGGINMLLESKDMRRLMGEKARKFVESGYDWDEITLRYESALSSLR